MSELAQAAFAAPITRGQAWWRRAGSLAAWLGYLFLVVPSVIVIPVSLNGTQELQFPPRELSLHLYREFFTQQAWWSAAVQSLIVGALTAVLALLIALPAAYGLSRTASRLRQVMEVALLSPMLVPVIILGLGLYMHLTGLRMTDSTAGLVLSHTVLVVPFTFISLMAGLRQTDPALETIAMVMGASRLRIVLTVVLPQIYGPMLVGSLFAFLISFDEVVVAYFVTGPASQTLPVKMYSAIKWEVSPVLAAVSTLLTLLSLAVCMLLSALQKRGENAARAALRTH
jgi:putative spermidine/putrescine transport system permease protein